MNDGKTTTCDAAQTLALAAPEPSLPVDDPRLVQALEEYRAALDRGERPNRAEFLTRFAAVGETLAECLTALEFVHVAAPALSDARANAAGSTPFSEADRAVPLSDYRIVRELGRGGMGVVYEAEQRSLGRRVALKVLPFAAALDAKQLQRFKNEALAAAQLHHPHIVPVYAVGCERGVHYYTMQFIEGQSLAEIIAQRMTAGQDTAGAPNATAYFRMVATVGMQAASALEHAHQVGVIHRDVKPANVLVDGNGNAWIADFGLAHFQSETRLTLSGDLVGTLRYMSPEQALANRVVVDHRTDIYSLGITLYELLTLEPAFAGDDRQELLRRIAFTEPRAPRRINRAIPADLETIVLKATAKLPEERYATAGELAEDLQRFLNDVPIKARRASLRERGVRWCRRNPFAACLLVALTAGSAFGIWHMSRLSSQLVRDSALESAAQESRMLAEAHNLYSEVVKRAEASGVKVKLEVYPEPEPAKDTVYMLVPATFIHALGDRINAKIEPGMRVRLYSAYPFKWRKDGGPRDDFEREALARLTSKPDEAVYEFTEYEGRPVLRYNAAWVLKASCLNCHNENENATKRDWQVGDVRGALEIIRPLDKDAERVRDGLRGTLLLMAAVVLSLLAVSAIVLVRRRRVPFAASSGPSLQ